MRKIFNISSQKKGLNLVWAILVCMCITLILACSTKNDLDQAKDQEQNLSLDIAKSLRIETAVREFNFLAPGEVAVGVLIKNISQNIIIIDYRSEAAREKYSLGETSDGFIMPLDALDFLSFTYENNNTLSKELRTSNVRRHRNSLEEGELFRSLEELVVLPPGLGIGVPAIIWSVDPEVVLGIDVKKVEVRFNSRMLMIPASEIKTKESWLVGTTLKNKAEWLSKEYIPVSVVGWIDLKPNNDIKSNK